MHSTRSPQLPTFQDFGISGRSATALARYGIDVPVAVQIETIPSLLSGRDVVVHAPTGSGKTLAYLLPLLERLQRPRPGPRALIVAPVRELAMQVEAVYRRLDPAGRSAVLYGGVGYGAQITALRRQPAVVIGTPGRLLDMIERGLLSLGRVEYLVLDEADEMLDSGFAPAVERLVALTGRRQTVLASATMPDWVAGMVRKHLVEPVQVRVAGGVSEPQLDHALVRVDGQAKLTTLSGVLRQSRGVIVFGRTRHGVRKLGRELRRLGHSAVELQGDMSQSARDQVMAAFRSRRSDVLVATNVAARGLDVSHVSLVVNYELPDTSDALRHRVGRTARMGNQGRALTFVSADDTAKWRQLRVLGAPDLPELDLEHLLADGGWRYLPAAPPAPAPGAPPRRFGRGRPGRGRGDVRSRRPSEPRTAPPRRSRPAAG